MNVFGSAAKDISVRSLERRASDDNPRASLLVHTESESQRAQPFSAIGVGERNAGRHLGDALLGVEFVPFHELDIERVGERGSNQGLPGARDSHHHEKAVFHQT